MPKAEDTVVLLELTPYALRAVRATNGKVEAAGECIFENRAAAAALVASLAGPGKEGFRTAAAVWPASAGWYVSTDTEAMLDRTPEAIRAIAANRQKNPGAALAYSSCNATDGGRVSVDGMDKWALTFAPLESLAKAQTALTDLKLVTESVAPAGMAAVGAAASALRAEGRGGSVVLWDIGPGGSSLLLVDERGLQATSECGVGMDKVFEAVQLALKLKFRGAGERLFFNEGYDFTEAGPKIAAGIGPAVKEALAALPALDGPPRLGSVALSGKQGWFLRELAKFAGIEAWEPGLRELCGALGVAFDDGSPIAALSAASAGLLGMLGSRLKGDASWAPEWEEAEGTVEEPEPPQAEPEPEPEPEPDLPPEPVRAPVAPVGRPKPSISMEFPSGGGTGRAPKPPAPAAAPAFPAAKPPAARPPGTPPSGRPPVPSAMPSGFSPPGRPPGPSAAPTSFPPTGRPPVPQGGPKPPPQRAAPPLPEPSGFPEPESQGRPPSFSNPGFPEPGGATQEAPPAARPPVQPGHGFPTPGGPPPAAGARPAKVPSMGFPEPGGTPAAPARPPSFSNPGFPVPDAAAPSEGGAQLPLPPGPRAAGLAGATTPPPAVTALPFDPTKAKLKAGLAGVAGVPAAAPPAAPPDPPKSRVTFYLIVGGAAALVFAVIAFVVDARLDKIHANDRELQEQEDRMKEEKTLLEAEQKMRADAEAHQKEMAEAVEAARKQAEEDTRKEMLAEAEAERIAKSPGTLVLATEPEGASVSVDGGPARASPLRMDGVPPGAHQVRVTLAGFEPVEMTATISGTKTTDLGTVALQSVYGSLAMSSVPDGLEFAVRPSGASLSAPIRTGRTPASLEKIPRGLYDVTFTRPGCHDHVEKAKVEHGRVTSVATTYVDGSLELSSDPSGASVSKDGMFLGTTPLVLHDLTPKTANFDLTLPGYDPTPVTCDIPEGQTLRYSAQLLRRDRVFTPGEVREAPVRVEAPPPALTDAQRRLGADVTLSVVVRRDGSVADVTISSATDDDIARRCVAAVEHWRYRAATAPDGRIVDSRIDVPFKFEPASQ